LLIYSHANGIVMCPVEPTGKNMGIAEVTDKIGPTERVDFMALELCLMGGIEIAYQWRPGNGRFHCDVLLAIPNAGPPLDWDRAFARIRTPGHASPRGPVLDPAAMSAADFGRLVIEEGYRGRLAGSKLSKEFVHESAGCYDLKLADGVKRAVDALSVELWRADAKNIVLELRGTGSAGDAIDYSRAGVFVDLYDLCRRIARCERLPGPVHEAAKTVMQSLDRFMIASFGMSGLKGFAAGKNGVYIVLPSGRPGGSKEFEWYTPLAGTGKGYSRLSFLQAETPSSNGQVRNWFELLHTWFPQPDDKGGKGEPKKSSATKAGTSAVTPTSKQPDSNIKLDPKVLEIVKQVSDLHKNAKSLHVEVTVRGSRERAEKQEEFDAVVTVDLEQPNRFALRSRHSNNENAGVTLVCNGKVLSAYLPKFNHYITTDAPTDLDEMGETLGRLGRPNTIALFANVLTPDPYEELMDGVQSCFYAGRETVEGTLAHHLKFHQKQLDWEMWVAAEGKPLVVKMTNTRSGRGGKLTVEEIYRNWKLDTAPGRDVFSFSPPEGAKEVESLANDLDRGA
jgi:hypothetical protein